MLELQLLTELVPIDLTKDIGSITYCNGKKYDGKAIKERQLELIDDLLSKYAIDTTSKEN